MPPCQEAARLADESKTLVRGSMVWEGKHGISFARAQQQQQRSAATALMCCIPAFPDAVHSSAGRPVAEGATGAPR